jgi:hypothetical protein
LEAAHWITTLVGVLAIGLAGGAAYFLWKRRSALALMDATRTITAAEAATLGTPAGTTVELYGIALSDSPLLSPGTGTPCVYYRYKVEEYQVRRVYDSDSIGGTRNEGQWCTVLDTSQVDPFQLKDSSGTIEVLPGGAEMVALEMLDSAGEGPQAESPLGNVAAMVTGGHSMEGRRRVSEWVVPMGQPVYVLGPVVQTPLGPRIENAQDRFIISVKPEQALSRSFKWQSIGWLGATCLLAATGTIAVVFALLRKPMTDGQVIWHNAYPFVIVGLAAAACLFGALSLSLFKWGGDDAKDLGASATRLIEGRVTGTGALDQADSGVIDGVKVEHCPECAGALPDGSVACVSCGWADASSKDSAPSDVAGHLAAPAAVLAAGIAASQAAQPAPAAAPPAGRPGVIQRDIVIEGRVAFEQGEHVNVEMESPDAHRPEYRYVVTSQALNRKFRLSDLDVFT